VTRLDISLTLGATPSAEGAASAPATALLTPSEQTALQEGAATMLCADGVAADAASDDDADCAIELVVRALAAVETEGVDSGETSMAGERRRLAGEDDTGEAMTASGHRARVVTLLRISPAPLKAHTSALVHNRTGFAEELTSAFASSGLPSSSIALQAAQEKLEVRSWVLITSMRTDTAESAAAEEVGRIERELGEAEAALARNLSQTLGVPPASVSITTRREVGGTLAAAPPPPPAATSESVLDAFQRRLQRERETVAIVVGSVLGVLACCCGLLCCISKCGWPSGKEHDVEHGRGRAVSATRGGRRISNSEITVTLAGCGGSDKVPAVVHEDAFRSPVFHTARI